jgi:L-lysine exporter family protein LysE/ArgO
MSAFYSVFITGFFVGFSLILAIGAQNAFVLKQGLRGQYVLMVVLICAGSDALLIAAGVSGFHWLVSEYPGIEQVARFAGAAFLLVYGALSFHSALVKQHQLDPASDLVHSQWKTALICLGFTWLNPHVYLDTLMLIGSISSQYPGQQIAFGAGAVSASFVFFGSLGYGAAALRPLFARPNAWKILEFIIGLIMWSIAAQLIWMQ